MRRKAGSRLGDERRAVSSRTLYDDGDLRHSPVTHPVGETPRLQTYTVLAGFSTLRSLDDETWLHLTRRRNRGCCGGRGSSVGETYARHRSVTSASDDRRVYGTDVPHGEAEDGFVALVHDHPLLYVDTGFGGEVRTRRQYTEDEERTYHPFHENG
jgi:hypothetical protein